MTDGENTNTEATKPTEPEQTAVQEPQKASSDLPPPPQQQAPSAEEIVARITDTVAQRVQEQQGNLDDKVNEVIKKRLLGDETKPEDPMKEIRDYMTKNPVDYARDISEHATKQAEERIYANLAKQAANRQKVQKFAQKVPDIAMVPNEVNADIVQVQKEYFAEHNVELDAADALETAMERTAKRLNLKELSEHDIRHTTIPSGGGGFTPQSNVKQVSAQDMIKTLQEQHSKFRKRQA